MPRKDFRADLTSASVPGLYPHLSDIREGDDDGSFCFVYTPPFSNDRYGIHVTTSPECSDYPKKHQFFAFSGDDSIPESISTVLSEYQPYAGHPRIDKFLSSINRALNNAVLNIESPSSASQQDSSGDAQAIEDDEWDIDSVDSYIKDEAASLRMLRSDLQPVKAAGYKVGFLGHATGSVILSISYRIKKLSLSTDVLRAWDVKESEYLVLLIRYPYGYLQMGSLLQKMTTGQKPLVEMHVGLCESYKPSLASALQHFPARKSPDGPSQDASGTIAGHEAVYRSLIIGDSLTSLLNKGLLLLLRYRLYYGLSWRDAEEYLHICQSRPQPAGGPTDQMFSNSDTWGEYSPSILKADHLRDKTDVSQCVFPLAAMQFVLRRFVRCTEFCLNCHRRIESGFETIKPYVCSDGLCLYQYISLGMGASVELEILTQPYVVDLLISLTCARAMQGTLADFPSSIGLKVPQLQPFFCSFNPACMTIRVGELRHLKAGDCLFLKATRPDNTRVQWHCTVRSAANFPVVEVSNFLARESTPDMVLENVELYTYDRDFDMLVDLEKCRAIIHLLDTLPSVDAMRDYITNGNRSLSSWDDQVSRSALYVLRWILASNRSYIVYEDNRENMVSGMAGYLQFRIAQGTPDKEARFVTAVRTACSDDKHKQIYPTLFAWHGSHVGNWHSILREGLHYRQVVNGRSMGDGVYMATRLETSLGYVRAGASGFWSHSKLNVGIVISLNEVVNSPAQFVCSSGGFYVVNQLDWIQMRYLFVSAGNVVGGASDGSPSNIYRQDPNRTAMGVNNQTIQVPMSATKTHRKIELHDKDKKRQKIGRTYKRDADSVVTLDEDVELIGLFAAEEQSPFRIDVSQTNFRPGSLKHSSLKLLGAPTYATSWATKALHRHLQETLKVQQAQFQHELGWYIDPSLVTNVYQWIVELHSFESTLPLAADLKNARISSIVTEIRFPPQFPVSPPFVRIIRPRLLSLRSGGGGHVTIGGSMCMELLTSSGWSPASSMESVLLQVRMALSNLEPQPARLDRKTQGDYNIVEAVDDYKRVCRLHGWNVPDDFNQIAWN